MPTAGSRWLSTFGTRFGAQRFGGPEPTLLAIHEATARLKRVQLDGFLLAASHADAVDDPEDVASWELEPVSPGAVPASITSVAFEEDVVLRVRTTDFSDGETYRLRVLGDLRFADGASARGLTVDFAATGDRPTVASVLPVSAKVVRVTFSEEVKADADLLDVANYVFGGASTLTAVSVSVVSALAVDVETLEEQVEGALYSLTVG